MIRLVKKFAFYFPFNPIFLYIYELVKNGSGAATIPDNKTRFSAVCLSVTIKLTGKFAFKLFPF